MKLRSYPDTVELKHREIGMYKSPLPSGRKPKVVSSSKSSMLSKSARKPKGMNSIYIYILSLIPRVHNRDYC